MHIQKQRHLHEGALGPPTMNLKTTECSDMEDVLFAAQSKMEYRVYIRGL